MKKTTDPLDIWLSQSLLQRGKSQWPDCHSMDLILETKFEYIHNFCSHSQSLNQPIYLMSIPRKTPIYILWWISTTWWTNIRYTGHTFSKSSFLFEIWIKPIMINTGGVIDLYSVLLPSHSLDLPGYPWNLWFSSILLIMTTNSSLDPLTHKSMCPLRIHMWAQ